MARVLVIDDEPQICGVISDWLGSMGLQCATAGGADDAKRLLTTGDFPVVVSDVHMPEGGGLELLAFAEHNSPRPKVILITGFADTTNLAEALRRGAFDYLEKPLDMDQLGQSVLRAIHGNEMDCYLPLRAAEAMKREPVLRQTAVQSIMALSQAVEAKDPYTRRHSDHVAFYAVEMARWMNLAAESLDTIRTAALLHDIGKIGIPDNILTKPGSLTDEEFSHIRRHPVLGEQILKNISALAIEATLVRHHHERWDGRGYPDGLAGEDIPLACRLINIADSMDAMLMMRTYKAAYSVPRMLSELVKASGTQFESGLAEMAIDWCRKNPGKLIVPNQAAA